MAVDLFFQPATIALPSKAALSDFGWEHIRDRTIRDAVAEEEQYLRFHRELLAKIHFTKRGCVANPPYKKRLDLTARAGLIRSTMLLYASIAEAVLCYHARERGYHLPPDPRNWTFGAVLNAWQDPPRSGQPRPDVAAVWSWLSGLRNLRNHVHLFGRVGDHRGQFEWSLGRENGLVAAGDGVLDHLRSIRSSHMG